MPEFDQLIQLLLIEKPEFSSWELDLEQNSHDFAKTKQLMSNLFAGIGTVIKETNDISIKNTECQEKIYLHSQIYF